MTDSSRAMNVLYISKHCHILTNEQDMTFVHNFWLATAKRSTRLYNGRLVKENPAPDFSLDWWTNPAHLESQQSPRYVVCIN